MAVQFFFSDGLKQRFNKFEAQIIEHVAAKLELIWGERVEARLQRILSRLETQPKARREFLLNTVSDELRDRVAETMREIESRRQEVEEIASRLRRFEVEQKGGVAGIGRQQIVVNQIY